MTPHHLHATAAAWSLKTALEHLAQLADDEATHIAAETLEAPALLRSPAWGRRHALGGHGDPTPGLAAVATAPRAPRRNRWADMHTRSLRKLGWLADQLPTAPAGPNPWWRIYDTIPRLQPGTAHVLARHLADEDTCVRAAVGCGPQRELLDAIACPNPRCAQRRIHIQTAGPPEVWTVVCAAECRCVGLACGCGMPGAVAGVAHIWPRAAVLHAA
ncbi:hypothetical protein [Salinispora arenicola]|uniref:hypothetical protein n=1 Tax=Salinispora arenicola TaxID=168697 RepID=UPI0016A6EDD3|nr:hypothetical protein [Salinispora arenicola]NIL64322.1 hypothetical protein [Salinispora arenicola]